MVQKQCKEFNQLSQEERVEIYTFLREWLSYRDIAKRLHRHHTTISREIKRNSIDVWWWKIVYKPIQAEKKRIKRREKANMWHIKLNKNIALRTKIYQLLSDKEKDRWPDEILWRLKKEWREIVSTPTLYRYIHSHWPTRTRLLLHKERWYAKRYSKEKRWTLNDWIPNIDQRDKIIETRETLYHWEWDTIVWKDHKSWAVTLVERKSRYLRIMKTRNFTSDTIYGIMLYLLYNEKINTLTTDNGKEFARLVDLQKKLNIQCYRAHPYASYERWTNEITNGLIRRYIPKGCDIHKYTNEEIQIIEHRINHKPRKILDYRTPYEVYNNINLSYII